MGSDPILRGEHIPPPKAMLLDLDDTILDDSSTIEECWGQACATHRAEFPGLDAAEVHAAIRRQSRWFWSDPERHRTGRLNLDVARAEVVRLGLMELGIWREGLAQKIAGAYSRRRDATVEALPEAIDTVRWLRARGIKLALITNGAG